MMRRPAILHVIPHAGGGVGAVLRAFLAADAAAEGLGITRWPASNISTMRRKRIATGTASPGSTKRLRPAVRCSGAAARSRHRSGALVEPSADDAVSGRRASARASGHVVACQRPISFAGVFPGAVRPAGPIRLHLAGVLCGPAVQQLPDRIRARLAVVRSFAGIPAGAETPCEKSGPFQAGYVGTVESVKMHPGFLRMCADADLPVPCIVAGGPAHEELRRQAVAANLDSRFRILGPVADPAPIFRKLHALAYPLSPRHYGTGENVLIEAMAFGAVPVVLANPAERGHRPPPRDRPDRGDRCGVLDGPAPEWRIRPSGAGWPRAAAAS